VRELQNVIEQQDMKIGSFNEEMKKSKRMMEGNAERYESRIGELKREVLVMRNGLKENEEVGNHKTKKGAEVEVEGRQYR
jgi:Mg2+ and Co2+ transporter CorA